MRWTLPTLALLALLAGGPGAGSSSGLPGGDGTPAPARQSVATERPNIVLILSDDQTLESMRVMKQTRRLLVDAGTSFSDAVVSYPLCCPSRATLLTGQYARNHGVLGNQKPWGGVTRLDADNTLPVWLQAAGYYTAHVGKYLNGYGSDTPAEVPPGWSRWFALVDPSTYELYDYTVSDQGRLVTYGSRSEDYQTDVLAGAAEEVIRQRAGHGEPFFLTVAPIAPHLERSDGAGKGMAPRPPQRYLGAFAEARLPEVPSFDEPDTSDKPAFIRKLPRLSTRGKETILDVYRAQLGTLLALDDLVARLVDALAETGQLEHTVVIFTSDNGFFHGEHRIPDAKFLPYEEAIHVPLVIRGGGFPAGAVADQLVSNIDLAPTIVALAGATAHRQMDGVALLPLAHDPQLLHDRAVLLEGLHGNRQPYEGVRTSRWKWIEYGNGARELYDLESDPYELRSLHSARRYAGVRAELAARLAALRRCAGESCR